MRPEPAALAALLLLAACDGGPQTAATAAQCYVPENLELASKPTPPDAIPDAPATGHLLALSWSPEFCRFRSDVPEYAGQCQDNRFGFILHGLWPQADTGPHPRLCQSAPPVSEELVRAHYCMTPSADLLQHEWAAHGTCAWPSAEAYYEDAASLWDRYRRPDMRRLSYNDALYPADIRAAFAEANEGLPAEAVGIELNERGWLEEVRLCLDPSYDPRPCAPAELGPTGKQAVSIWRGGR